MSDLRTKIEKIIEQEYLNYSGKGVSWHVKAATLIAKIPELSARLDPPQPAPEPTAEGA